MISGSSAVPRTRQRRWPVPLGWTNASGIAFLLAVAVIWQLGMSTGLLTFQYLPTPIAVVRATVDLVRSGALAANFAHTMYVTMVGWIASAALGIMLGLALGLSLTAWRFSMASIEFLRALPAIAFVPVAVLILGFSVKMELVIVIYVSIWPVLIGTIHGTRQVTPLHRDVAEMLHMGWLERVRRLVLPTTTPFVFVGLQISLSLALALALVAEMVGNPKGVGQALIVAQNTLHPAEMFAYVVLVGILGVALNAALLRLQAAVFPGIYSAGGARS